MFRENEEVMNIYIVKEGELEVKKNVYDSKVANRRV